MKSLYFICFCLSLSLINGQTYPSDANNAAFWTTNYGAPVYDNDNSLTVGRRGPTLLEDYTLIEKLANFDRERIPERVVHAVGATAKGNFKVTGDVSMFTFADFLQPGRQTDLIVRFSTVIPSRGAPETVRDPRGFAVKFYTRQGNYDLVGNNMPVFFIRDGMKFPDMVHSLKPNPITNNQEWFRIWDFFSTHPESMHMFTHLLDDIGIPANFRQMDGSGVHTFKWINSTGYEKFVKYHWKTNQGVASLIDDASVNAITSPNHASMDLYNSIMSGQYPSWSLKVQIMDPTVVDSLDFDPLDVTKTWPVDQFPLMDVGTMTLNQTIDNFFTENEQTAFAPSNIVPGIYYSDDKLLQARLFSYPDTQRYRLGGNYLMLPVNAPRVSYHNNHIDGVMNFMKRSSAINYFPSNIDTVGNAPAYPIRNDLLTGKATRAIIDKENNFAQAGVLFGTYDTARQNRFIARLIQALQAPVAVSTRNTIIGYWSNVNNGTIGAALRTAFHL